MWLKLLIRKLLYNNLIKIFPSDLYKFVTIFVVVVIVVVAERNQKRLYSPERQKIGRLGNCKTGKSVRSGRLGTEQGETLSIGKGKREPWPFHGGKNKTC